MSAHCTRGFRQGLLTLALSLPSGCFPCSAPGVSDADTGASDAGPPPCVERTALRVVSGYDPRSYYTPFLVADGAGGAVVVWTEPGLAGLAGLPGTGYVRAQRFTLDGSDWNGGEPATLLTGSGYEVVCSKPVSTRAARSGLRGPVEYGTPGFHLAWTDVSVDGCGDTYVNQFGLDGLPLGEPQPLDVGPGGAWTVMAWPDLFGGVFIFQDPAVVGGPCQPEEPYYLSTEAYRVGPDGARVWGPILPLSGPGWFTFAHPDWTGGYWESGLSAEVDVGLTEIVSFHRGADGSETYPGGVAISDTDHYHEPGEVTSVPDGQYAVIVRRLFPEPEGPERWAGWFSLQFVTNLDGPALPDDGVPLFDGGFVNPIYWVLARPDGRLLLVYASRAAGDELDPADPCFAQVFGPDGQPPWAAPRAIGGGVTAGSSCHAARDSTAFGFSTYAWHEDGTLTIAARPREDWAGNAEIVPVATRFDADMNVLWPGDGDVPLADCPAAIFEANVVPDGNGGIYAAWPALRLDLPGNVFDLWMSHVDAAGNVGFGTR